MTAPEDLSELELRRAVAVAANEARSLDEAMTTALAQICDYTGWPVGHIYLSTTDGQLVSTILWHLAHRRHRAIQEGLRYGTFNPRLGPPGEVLVGGRALWLRDSRQAVGFVAADAAREQGLPGWVGFPIVAAGTCVGVIEFYADLDGTDQEAPMTRIMAEVGTQLGRVVERQRSEDERTESLIREQFLNAWFRSLLQSTEEGICGLDLDGSVTFVNRAGADLLGYTAEELQGLQLHSTAHHTRADGSPYPPAECPILQAARTGAGVRVDTDVLWRRDGTSFPAEYSSHAIVDLGGDVRGIVLTFIDITDRRREEQAARTLNQALMTTKEELERANLLKSDFLATMSHELRTPLNAIIGFAGLMQNGLGGEVSATGADYLERINRNAQVLLALIGDVLDLSKLEANRMPINPRVIDVAAVVSRVVENMQSLADGKGLALEIHGFTASPLALADERAVQQVMANLLSNAIKFTEKGGVTVELRSDESRLIVEVTDTGPGIAPEDQAQVFEAFRQVGAHARTGTGGTGLGLAISKRLARGLGSDLVVTSDVGAGSRFRFDLHAAVASQGIQGARAAPGPTILWVTSDYASLSRVSDWVGALDLGFIGIAALDQAVRAAVEIQPVAIALDLPDGRARDLLTHIKEDPRLAKVEVLLVTDPESPTAGTFPGVGQLRRPLALAQLEAVLAQVRQRWEEAGPG